MQITWMPVPETLSPFTPLLAMIPLSRNTKKLTTQKAISSLAGVYQAGSELIVPSEAEAVKVG